MGATAAQDVQASSDPTPSCGSQPSTARSSTVSVPALVLQASSSVPALPSIQEADVRKSNLAETLAQMKKRKEKADPTLHLKRSALQQGTPQNLTTTYALNLQRPIQMANE